MPAPSELGSVYEREARSQWVAAVRAGHRFADGRVLPKTREFTSKTSRSDAMAKRRRWVTAQDERRRRDNTQTVAEFVTDWINNVVKVSVRSNTFKSYESTARLHIIPEIGDYRLADLEPDHVQAMIRRLSTKPRAGRSRKVKAAGRPLSPTTVNYARKILSQAMERAVALELLTKNPVSLAAAVRVPKSEVEPFDESESRAILDAVADHRLEAYFTVISAVGIRVSEGLGIRWKDLDLETGILRVRGQLQRPDGVFTLTEPKSEAGIRTIPLPAFAVESLQTHRERQLFEKRGARGAWDNTLDLVFVTELGQPLHRRNVLRQFQSGILGPLKLSGDLKRLRHSAATMLAVQGAAPREIMEILGHSDPRIALKVYVHVAGGRKREIADRIDAWRRAEG